MITDKYRNRCRNAGGLALLEDSCRWPESARSRSHTGGLELLEDKCPGFEISMGGVNAVGLALLEDTGVVTLMA